MSSLRTARQEMLPKYSATSSCQRLALLPILRISDSKRWVLKQTKDKVVVNQWYETNVRGIYAIGDITEGPALAHVASAEGDHLC